MAKVSYPVDPMKTDAVGWMASHLRPSRWCRRAGPIYSRGVAMEQSRALRYRKLALQEPDKEKAQLLQLLADEADRGILCSVEWTRHSPKIKTPIKSIEVGYD